MMNKEKFLNILRKKLSVLEENEIEENIEEYSNFIDEKVSKGATEEEAVKALGNPEVLAKEILSAYKIKSDNLDSHDMINSVVNKLMNIFDNIINIFSNKSYNEIIRFVLELIVIFVVIAICKIPFYIIEEIGRNIFTSFDLSIFRVMNSIWAFILEIAYLLFAILLFIKIFENHFSEEIIKTKENKKDNKKNKSEKSKKVVSEKREKSEKQIVVHQTSFGDFLSKICIWFIKFIFIMCLMGVSFYLIGMSFMIGIVIYLLFKGVFYVGAYLIVLSLLSLGIVVFIMLFNYIFDHKNKLGLLLIVSIISIGLLGLGTGIFAIEFASSTIEYKENRDYNKQEEFVYQVSDDLIIPQSILNDENVVIDDNMGSDFKIVYSYNDKYFESITKPEISYYKNYKILHTRYFVTSFRYNHEYLDKFINNLKKKKIIIENFDNFDIKIYLSNESLEKMKKNQKKYDYYDHDFDLEDICNSLNEDGYELPSYCRDYVLENEL